MSNIRFDEVNKNVRKKDRSFYSKKNIIIITCIVSIIFVVIVIFLGTREKEKTIRSSTIEIIGDTSIVIYKGQNYNDPGAKAYDEDKNDLSEQIVVKNNVDTSKTGKYFVVYKLGKMTVRRVVNVIETPIDDDRVIVVPTPENGEIDSGQFSNDNKDMTED